MNKLFAIVGVLAFLPLTSVVAEESMAEDAHRFHFSTEFGTRWEDNIGLTGDDTNPDFVGDAEFDDLTYQFSATLGYDLFRTRSHEISASVTPFYNRVDDLGGLTNWGLTTGMQYRGEIGPAFTDLWYGFSVDYTFADFDESRIREGDWWEAELIVGKRFNPKFGLSGGARWLDRGQDNDKGLCPTRSNADCPGFWGPDEVFEQERWGAFIHADWFLTDKTSFFIEYSYWDGDEDATSPLRGCNRSDSPCLVNTADTFADDPAFGNAQFGALANPVPFTVWRVEAKQHIVELGWRQALTDKITFELVGAFMETSDVVSPDEARGPNPRRPGDQDLDDYSNNAVMASFSFSLR